MKVTLSSKGQITLPKEIRESMLIKKGDTLKIEIIKPGKVVLEVEQKNNKQDEEDLLLCTFGAWKDLELDDDYIENLRKSSGRRLEEIEIPD